MVSYFRAEQNDLIQFSNRLEVLRAKIPEMQADFFREVGAELVRLLQEITESRGISVTRTYIDSFVYHVNEGVAGQSELIVEMEPTGPEADKLEVYWKVLESGLQPARTVPPTFRIVQWAEARGMSPNLGGFIAKSMRKKGIKSNPIIKLVFELDAVFQPISLKSPGMFILIDAFNTYSAEFKSYLIRTPTAAAAASGKLETTKHSTSASGRQLHRRSPAGIFVKIYEG